MFKIIYLFGIKRTVKDNKIYCSNTLMFLKKKSFSYAGYNGNVKISLVLEIFLEIPDLMSVILSVLVV